LDRAPRQPVELGHNQHVASLNLIERALQFRPPGGNARYLLAEYPLNACGQEQRLLRRKRLPGRTDAGVSIGCHFAPDIRTKVMRNITTSAIWCANNKFYNRKRGIKALGVRLPVRKPPRMRLTRASILSNELCWMGGSCWTTFSNVRRLVPACTAIGRIGLGEACFSGARGRCRGSDGSAQAASACAGSGVGPANACLRKGTSRKGSQEAGCRHRDLGYRQDE